MVSCGKSAGSDGPQQNDTIGVLPDTLRVATLYSPSSFFIFRDQQMGYDFELIRNILSEHNIALHLEVSPSLQAAIELLDSGKVDLIAYEVPITADYAGHAIPCGIRSVTHQVLVQPRSSDSIVTDVTQLVGRNVYVEANSKYEQRMANLNNELGGGINIIPLEMDTLISEDVIEMVKEGKIPLTVVDSDIAKVNRTYFPSLNVDLAVSLDQESAWAVSPGNRQLADSIDAWTTGTAPRRMQAELMRRYFELSKNDPNIYTLDFSKGKISPFDNLFRQHASNKAHWDWRLLAAQAFVESRFDASQVSWAGARGIMQIMPATARAYGVSADRLTDNATSIDLALKIIERLDQSLASKVPDPAERRKFVLAAYNAGIAHIYDAIALAKVTGHDPQRWDGNVEAALLLKSRPEYYNNPVCRYGYFRGRQTTEYVRSVTELFNHASRKVNYMSSR